VNEVEGLAIAWTRHAVHVQWKLEWMTRTDWIPVQDVRRRPKPPAGSTARKYSNQPAA
jgi:hypothetical protein